MKWLMVPLAVLAVGLPKACQGTHEVHLPPSKECPSGTWVVTSEGDTTNAVCKGSPSASPVSSPSPTTPPSASPVPEPSASPSPVASPSPAPEPSPAVGTVIAVKDGECPAAYPRKPNHVKVGGNARRAPANQFAWLINLSPLMSAADGYCADVAGGTRTFPGYPGMCEQWLPCAFQGRHDDNDPKSSWEPAVYAEGPGFKWDHVESRSRDAAFWEKPCPDSDKHCYINYYLKNLVLGDGGSGPGHYRVCAAPTEDEVKDRNKIGPNAECGEFDLTLP